MLILSTFRGDAGGKLDIGRAMSFVPQHPQAASAASPVEVRLKGTCSMRSSIHWPKCLLMCEVVGMPALHATTSRKLLVQRWASPLVQQEQKT